MKFTTTKEQLLSVITRADKVVGKRLSLNVLNYIVISVGGGKALVRATNLDLGLEISLPTTSDEDGECALPGSVLLSILNTSSNQDRVTISTLVGNAQIETQHSKTLIKSIPTDDFPNIPRVEKGSTYDIPLYDFLHGLRSVVYSAMISSMKPELSSVYVSGKAGALTFVATDSFRLAEKVVPLKVGVDMPPILIPAKNATDIIRVLGGESGGVTISVNENQISFSTGALYLTSRLTTGSFPDYRQIIPKKATTEVVVLKQDLLSALKRASLFTNSFNQVHFAASGKKFSLESSNQDVGETKEEVPAAISGEPAAMNFNYRYVVDCFQSIPTDSVSLSLHGSSKPMVVRGVGDNSFLYLVMPMNR